MKNQKINVKAVKKKSFINSPIKRKIFLLLLAGIAISGTRSHKKHKMIFRGLRSEWKEIDRAYLYRVVNEFHRDRLVSYEEMPDGTTKIVLSEKGKHKAIQCDFDTMEIKIPSRWDKKWRIVIFDVPEYKKLVRDSLRRKLQQLGFVEYQHSAFIFPFPCRDEIDFVVEFFEAREFVRYGEVINFTNDDELKLRFNLV
jgi:hypothetical protein